MNLFETILILISTWWMLWFGVDAVDEKIEPIREKALVVNVIDGDTIDVWYQGTTTRVRYIGIDTPEPYREGTPECGSAEATAENTKLVAGKTVELIADREDKDKYGRWLRYVYVDEVFVNAKLVQSGYATALTIPPNTTFADDFIKWASLAKDSGVGLWALPCSQAY